MGVLHYGSFTYTFDDRLLAHIQVVVGLKLRRGESFFLTWRASPAVGDGRHAIWIDNGMPIHCEYFGGRQPSINRGIIEAWVTAAGSSGGLHVGEENDFAEFAP
jgi:hypothetical protein